MKKFIALSLSDVVFTMLINLKMPLIVGILTFMSRILCSAAEHEKFYNLGAWPIYKGFRNACFILSDSSLKFRTNKTMHHLQKLAYMPLYCSQKQDAGHV